MAQCRKIGQTCMFGGGVKREQTTTKKEEKRVIELAKTKIKESYEMLGRFRKLLRRIKLWSTSLTNLSIHPSTKLTPSLTALRSGLSRPSAHHSSAHALFPHQRRRDACSIVFPSLLPSLPALSVLERKRTN